MNKDHYRKRVTEPVQQMSVIAPEKPSARDWFPEERVTRLENQGNEPPGEVATGDLLRHRVDAEVGPLGSKLQPQAENSRSATANAMGSGEETACCNLSPSCYGATDSASLGGGPVRVRGACPLPSTRRLARTKDTRARVGGPPRPQQPSLPGQGEGGAAPDGRRMADAESYRALGVIRLAPRRPCRGRAERLGQVLRPRSIRFVCR